MKKLLFALCVLFSIALFSNAKSQTVDFCTSFTKDGVANDSYTEWDCTNNSCYLYALLKYPASIRNYYYNPQYLNFYIYRFNKSTNKYEYQDYEVMKVTSTSNDWFAKKLTFKQAGWYKVDIYMDDAHVGYSELHWNFK